jgi:hypothetical protein
MTGTPWLCIEKVSVAAASNLSQLGHRFVGDTEIGRDALDVVVVIEFFD